MAALKVFGSGSYTNVSVLEAALDTVGLVGPGYPRAPALSDRLTTPGWLKVTLTWI